MGTYSRRIRWLLAVFLLLLPPLLTSCTPEEGDPHRFEVTEQEGVEIATTRGGPKYVGELFDYEEVLRLVPDPDDPASYLTSPRPPVLDGDGRIYVVDRMANRIAVFDSSGTFLMSIGRAGEGPGDLGRPRELRIIAGLLQVNSHTVQWRLTRFTPGGRLVDLTVREMPLDSVIPTLVMSPSGEVLTCTSRRPRVGEWEYAYAETAIYAPEGDTVAVVRTPRIPYARYVRIAWDDRVTDYPLRVQYNGRPLMDYHPEVGLFASTGMESEITFYDLGGRLVRRVRVELEPQEVTDSERRVYLDRIEALLEQERGRPEPDRYSIERFEAMFRGAEFPEYRAFWREVEVDDAGWLWLSLVEAPEATPQFETGSRWRVLDERGEYLGVTTWPRLMNAQVSMGHLTGVREDVDTGEHIPVIFRIRPTAEGLRYP